jgi:formylglycine-generating enzyme required for sulfatase activity
VIFNRLGDYLDSAKYLREAREILQTQRIIVKLGDDIPMVFAAIPAGTFTMGSPASEKGRDDDENQHEVTLTKPFHLGIYEVTQAQWRVVMRNNPSEFEGDDRPVENVSWNNADEFCRKMSNLTGWKVRLPTEAEWEYACRAGTTTRFNTGMDLAANQANFNSKETVDVGSFRPNAWGLYDMHGNVWEWCSDWYGGYDASAKNDPHGVVNGSDRVLRGGGWINDARSCRSANRNWIVPGYRDDGIGFRVVLDL